MWCALKAINIWINWRSRWTDRCRKYRYIACHACNPSKPPNNLCICANNKSSAVVFKLPVCDDSFLHILLFVFFCVNFYIPSSSIRAQKLITANSSLNRPRTKSNQKVHFTIKYNNIKTGIDCVVGF